jgi:hypothetical protein
MEVFCGFIPRPCVVACALFAHEAFLLPVAGCFTIARTVVRSASRSASSMPSASRISARLRWRRLPHAPAPWPGNQARRAAAGAEARGLLSPSYQCPAAGSESRSGSASNVSSRRRDGRCLPTRTGRWMNGRGHHHRGGAAPAEAAAAGCP